MYVYKIRKKIYIHTYKIRKYHLKLRKLSQFCLLRWSVELGSMLTFQFKHEQENEKMRAKHCSEQRPNLDP